MKHESGIVFAYLSWRGMGFKNRIDEIVEQYLAISVGKENAENINWVELARYGRELSRRTVAEKLSISEHAFRKLEIGARSGTISVQKLRQIAEVLDCDLVIALRPKSRRTFSVDTWSKMIGIAKLKIKNQNFSTPLQYYRRLSAEVRNLYRNPDFRRQQGWSERIPD